MTTQHTPEFTEEMKKLLDTEKARLEQELRQTDTFPDYGRNEEDNATEIADYAATTATNTTLEERLKNVTEALERIQSGSYGITSTGDLIPVDRLRANPAATDIVK